MEGFALHSRVLALAYFIVDFARLQQSFGLASEVSLLHLHLWLPFSSFSFFLTWIQSFDSVAIPLHVILRTLCMHAS